MNNRLTHAQELECCRLIMSECNIIKQTDSTIEAMESFEIALHELVKLTKSRIARAEEFKIQVQQALIEI